MSDILPAVRTALEATGHPFDVMDCDPALADTARFCEHYQIPLEQSANAILIKSKSGEPRYALCVLLAIHRLDVNHTVRKKLEVRRISFASAEETREITGMEIGGVTPVALPPELPIWVDAHVMQCESIILGGGNRSSKLRLAPTIFDHVASAEVVEGLVKLPAADQDEAR